MIVIKLNINGKGLPFNFVFRTSGDWPYADNRSQIGRLDKYYVNKRTLKISGIGEGEDYEAYVTSALKYKYPGLVML